MTRFPSRPAAGLLRTLLSLFLFVVTASFAAAQNEPTGRCSVIDRGGKLLNQKMCSVQRTDDTTTYTWPAGTKSIVRRSGSTIELNGVAAETSGAMRGADCVTSSKTGNTFCFAKAPANDDEAKRAAKPSVAAKPTAPTKSVAQPATAPPASSPPQAPTEAPVDAAETAKSLPTPQAAVGKTVAAGQTAVICNPATSSASVRPGPSAKNHPAVLDTLANGTSISIRERVMNAEAGREWYKISYSSLKTATLSEGFVDSIAVGDDCTVPQLIKTFSAPPSAVTSLDFSRDGKLLVSAHGDGKARVWDAVSGKLRHTLSDAEDPLLNAKISPDGAIVATIGESGNLKVFNLQTGASAVAIADMQGRALAFSAFELAAAPFSAGPDGHVKRSRLGKEPEKFKFEATSDRPLGVGLQDLLLYTRSGNEFFAAGSDGTLALITPTFARLSFQGHTGIVRSVALASDDLRIASAGDDGTVRIWEIWEEAELQLIRLATERDQRPQAVAFNSAGTRVIVAVGQTASAFDAMDGRQLWTIPPAKMPIRALAVQPATDHVAVAGDDGSIRLWALPVSPQQHSREQARLDEHMRPLNLRRERAKALADSNCERVSELDGQLPGKHYLSRCEEQRIIVAANKERSRLSKERDDAFKAKNCERVAELDRKLGPGVNYAALCLKDKREAALKEGDCTEVKRLDDRLGEKEKPEFENCKTSNKSGVQAKIASAQKEYEIAHEQLLKTTKEHAKRAALHIAAGANYCKLLTHCDPGEAICETIRSKALEEGENAIHEALAARKDSAEVAKYGSLGGEISEALLLRAQCRVLKKTELTAPDISASLAEIEKATELVFPLGNERIRVESLVKSLKQKSKEK